MSNFSIYNQSSESLAGIQDNELDLIIAGPPYNIGTEYGAGADSLKFSDYVLMLENIFSECYRVAKPGGVMLVEASDTILSEGRYVELGTLIQELCLKKGFSLWQRHINFSKTNQGRELLEHGWDENCSTTSNAHSNSHQWLVFKKEELPFDESAGRVHYINYPHDEEGHPCPFSADHIETFLGYYFKPGMKVLDPFMGTGRLGEAVIKRGGYYYGVEKEEKHFKTAEQRLNNIN